jgi:hypothetical protein
MGVDVGVTCHVIIREATPLQVMGNDVPFRARLRFAGTVTSFAELAPLMEKYKVDATCIDLYPETQLVTQFATSCRRRVFLADYDHYQPGHKLSGDMRTISANRTDVLDEMVDRFRRGLLPLPADARYLGGRVKEGYGEYYREMMALGRTLERDAHGNPRAKWVDNRKADHYFHSEVYCMLADAYRRTGLIKAW